MESKDNDQINIKVTNMPGNKVTVMIVKETKYGEIEYIPDMVFHPVIDGHFYSFQLHKL